MTKVNFAINGTFRYHRYVKHFAEAGYLNRLYYAHRISTTAAAIGLSEEQAVNIFWKEYLLAAHLRYLKPSNTPRWYQFYSQMFQSAVLKRWSPADITQVVIGGISDRIVARAKADGGRVIGHSVTPHLNEHFAILNNEADKFGTSRTSLPSAAIDQYKAELAGSDLILVDSKYSQRSFVERGIPPERIVRLMPGNDEMHFFPPADNEPSPLDTGVFRVICVAGVCLRKGQRYLLDAWRKLNLPNAELLLVGGLSHESRKILKPFAGGFRHIEHVPNHELRRYLGASSVFVLPTLSDGFPQVIPEALACGVPVITTENCGSADLISDGQNGFVVSVCDSDALAECILRLYDNADLRKSMGQAARLTVKSQNGWKNYARDLCHLYDRF